MGRREVLELVDEQVPARALHRAAERAVGEQHLDGGVDLLVEVDGAAPARWSRNAGNSSASPGTSSRDGLDVVGVGAARGGSPSAPRRTGRSDRCWPGAGGGRGAATRRGGAPRARRRTGGDAPRCSASTHSPSELSVRTRGRKSVVRGLHLQLGLLVVGDGEDRRPARTPRSRWRWRRRSVSTRVLPEPAGAITRAGPPTWATAASWSGARSASGRRRGGTTVERAEVDGLAVHDASPVGRTASAARRRSTPACRRAA